MILIFLSLVNVTNVQSCRYIWIRKQNIMMAFKSVHQQTSYTCHIPHIEQVKVKPSPRHEGARVWYTYMYLISGFRGAKFLRVTDPPTHTPGMDACPSQYSQRIPVPSFSWVDWDILDFEPATYHWWPLNNVFHHIEQHTEKVTSFFYLSNLNKLTTRTSNKH